MTAQEKLFSRITRRELIKPISVGLFGFAVFDLLKNPLSTEFESAKTLLAVPGELPPIIIKSGSFTIESDEELKESGNGPYLYKRMAFDLIKAVRVIKVNEHTGATQPFPFVDESGIEIDILLQHFVSGNWQPLPQSSPAQIKNEPAGKSSNFVLSIGKELGKKGKSKPKRKEKREDKGNDVFRFGSITVRELGNKKTTAIPPTVEGDEYVIGLYNYTEK